MSKYTFTKKQTTHSNEEIKEEKKIMNASATPEENTTVVYKKTTPIVTAPIEEDDEDDLFPSDNSDDKKSKKSFGFDSLFKKSASHSSAHDDDIISKVVDIFGEEDVSVEEIRENLSNDKKINLSDVFSDRKSKHTKADTSEELSYEPEEDTYEGLEETAIEEDTDFYTDSPDDDIIIPPKPKKERKKKEQREFLVPEDKEEITELYRKKGQSALIAFIISLISTIALIFVETKALPHPEWLTPGKYGLLYLMTDMEFVLISAICVFTPIVNGAVELFKWKPNKNSVTFVAFAVTMLQIFIHLIFHKYAKNISLYSSVFSLMCTLTALITYVDARREHISFRIAASSNTKTVVSPLGEDSTEYEKFSEYLPQDACMYKIEKTNFVSDFFKTTAKPSPYDEMYKITVPLVFIASLIFSILTFALDKSVNFCDAINNFTATFMIALPVSSLFTVSLPFFATTLRLSRLQSAIVGESSVEEYANTSLISFADTDVFNPKGIKITSIKTYGTSRIDNTYLMAARAFNLVGGPLKEVFNRSVIATANDISSDEITEITENGFTAVIDSHNIHIGNRENIIARGFAPIDDALDRPFETSNGRIMYVALDGEISAKFYIKYALGRNFKALLDSFRNIGICMAINTRDPNLDTKFITQILKDTDYPIIAVKNCDMPEELPPSEKQSSGILTVSSVPNMLRTFLSADKLSRIISINTLTKYISLIFAITLVVVAFLADGSQEKITPLFIILYQFIWSLPVIATSFFG